MDFIFKIKKSFFYLVLGFIFFTLNSSAFATLLPPWYILQNQLKAVLQNDTCVHVANLVGSGRDMKIVVDVCDNNKAQSLAAFISKQHEFGSKLMVDVVVVSNQSIIKPEPIYNTNQALSLMKQALEGNKHFVQAGGNSDVMFAEFKPTVIQYLSDDISDWYRNTNLVAAEAFKQVLNLDKLIAVGIRVYTTTTPVNR